MNKTDILKRSIIFPLTAVIYFAVLFEYGNKAVYIFLIALIIVLSFLFVKLNNFEYIMEAAFLTVAAFVPMVIIRKFHDNFYYGKSRYIAYFLLLILFSYLVKKIHKKELPKITFIDKLLILYAILIILSTIFSCDILKSLDGRIGRREGAVVLIAYVFFMFFASKFYKYKRIHINIILFSAVLISVYSFVQFYCGIDLITGIKLQKYAQAVGTFGNRNFMGSFISLLLPLSICAFIYTKSKFYFFSSMIMFAGLSCALTRSAWLAFFIYFIFILCRFIKKKKYSKRIISLIIGFLICFTIINITSKWNPVRVIFGSIKNEEKDMLNDNFSKLGSYRIFIWKRSLKLVMLHPVFGSGVDTTENIFMKYYKNDVKKFMGDNISVDKAHNEVLQIMVTEGIPAAAVYILLVFYVIYKGYKNKDNIIVFSLLCSVISYFVQSMFNISNVGIASTYWLFLGIIISALKCNKLIN